jgi:predicted RNA polymerase sigma factor
VTAGAAIEAVWRIEQPKLAARLAPYLCDVGLAEEIAQDAFVAALDPPAPGTAFRAGKLQKVSRRSREKFVSLRPCRTDTMVSPIPSSNGVLPAPA